MVNFYPDSLQFGFNTNDFSREQFLNIEMIGAIDYFVVPTECPLEEIEVEVRVKREKSGSEKKKKSGSSSKKKRGSSSKKKRRNLRSNKKVLRMLDHSGSGSDNDPCNLNLKAGTGSSSKKKSGSSNKRMLGSSSKKTCTGKSCKTASYEMEI